MAKQNSAGDYALQFFRSMPVPKTVMPRPILIGMMGVVGAGKTTVARMLARKLHLTHIRTDDIRVFLTKQGVPRERALNKAVPVAQQIARMLLAQQKGIVLDADFTFPKRQEHIRKLAQHYRATAYFIRVVSPEQRILERLRRHRYTRYDIFSSAHDAIAVYYMRKKLHRGLSGGARPFATVNNTQPLVPQIQKIVQKIKDKQS